MLFEQHDYRAAVGQLLDDRRNHQGPETHRILCDDQEGDLPSQRDAQKAVEEFGMSNRRRIIAAYGLLQKIAGREYNQAVQTGN